MHYHADISEDAAEQIFVLAHQKKILERDENAQKLWNELVQERWGSTAHDRCRLQEIIEFAVEQSVMNNENFEKHYAPIWEKRLQFFYFLKNHRKEELLARDRWAFFNQPYAIPDFSYWSACDAFSIEEAVAISLGKDPTRVTLDLMREYFDEDETPFAVEYFRRFQLIERAISVKVLTLPISRTELVRWAIERHIEFPIEMVIGKKCDDSEIVDITSFNAALSKMNELEAKIAQENALTDELAPKRRRSLYKMIAAMAISRFEHKTVGHSIAIKAIVGAIEDLKLESSLGDDAVRSILSEACADLGIVREHASRGPSKRS